MNNLNQESLIDRNELIRRYPALGAKKHRLNWMIRNRSIPLIKINRSVFFNPRKIDEWIRDSEVEARIKTKTLEIFALSLHVPR